MQSGKHLAIILCTAHDAGPNSESDGENELVPCMPNRRSMRLLAGHPVVMCLLAFRSFLLLSLLCFRL